MSKKLKTRALGFDTCAEYKHQPQPRPLKNKNNCRWKCLKCMSKAFGMLFQGIQFTNLQKRMLIRASHLRKHYPHLHLLRSQQLQPKVPYQRRQLLKLSQVSIYHPRYLTSNIDIERFIMSTSRHEYEICKILLYTLSSCRFL